MSVLDKYGEFEIPEEKSLVEVDEDPVKTMMSCYEMFTKTVCCEHNTEYELLLSKLCNYLDYPHLSDLQKAEQIYQNTLKLFEGKEKLNFNAKQLKDLFQGWEEINEKSGRYSYPPILGLFISAMHNETLLDMISIHEVYDQLGWGYKLKKNKVLVLNQRVGNLTLTGYLSEGVLINRGKLPKMGLRTKSGIQINNGSIDNFGAYSEGGVFINNNKSNFIANYNSQGIYINNGYAYDLSTSGNIGINNGLVDGMGTGIDLIKDLITNKKLAPLKQKLDLKLHELDFLKGLNKVSYEDQLKLLREFRWNRFEKDITAIANEIKEADERLKCWQ